MKKYWSNTLLVLVVVLTASCLDYRGRIIKRATKDFKSGLITNLQYDSIVSIFYTLKKETFSFNNRLIKVNGVYLHKYLEFDSANYNYSVIKLDSLGNIYLSQKLNFFPDNETLSKLYFFKSRYSILEGELLFETIQITSGDLNTHNIIQYARINGDTLIFYKNINVTNSGYTSQINPVKKYIFIDSLTENIQYPPVSVPINNTY